MKRQGSFLEKAAHLPFADRMLTDRQYRILVRAVVSLIFNLLFAFYNGILGALSSSLIFAASSVYYFLLSTMRFSAVMLERKRRANSALAVIGILLIVLSVAFQTMVIISMKYQTAASYGTVPMITIATYTFAKITTASIAAVKHRTKANKLIFAINAIRYCEVAVSLLTMQQSMLVSFGDGYDSSAVILNTFTGALVCFFILTMGILTLKHNRKEFL